MKRAKLNDVFLWEGELVEVFAVSENERVVVFKPTGKEPCPECGHDHRSGVIESSPLFQERAKPVATLEDC